MSLFVLFRYDPRFDTVQDHVIHCDSISQMDWSLYSEHTQNLKLNRGQVVKQVVKLDVFSSLLDTLINGYDELIGLLNGKLSLCIDNGLHSGLDEFLLEQIQVLEVVFFVNEVVFQ